MAAGGQVHTAISRQQLTPQEQYSRSVVGSSTAMAFMKHTAVHQYIQRYNIPLPPAHLGAHQPRHALKLGDVIVLRGDPAAEVVRVLGPDRQHGVHGLVRQGLALAARQPVYLPAVEVPRDAAGLPVKRVRAAEGAGSSSK